MWLWTSLPILASVVTPALQLGMFRCITWPLAHRTATQDIPSMEQM